MKCNLPFVFLSGNRYKSQFHACLFFPTPSPGSNLSSYNCCYHKSSFGEEEKKFGVAFYKRGSFSTSREVWFGLVSCPTGWNNKEILHSNVLGLAGLAEWTGRGRVERKRKFYNYINTSSAWRHNLPPSLEIITGNFPNVSKIYEIFEEKNPKF